MNVGGRELGCNGKDPMWPMSCDVKFIVADSASSQAKWPDMGETLELPVGVGARDRSLGSG
jgi:hypothetical protein